MSAPKLCDKCGLWHRGSICALGGETVRIRAVNALGETLAESRIVLDGKIPDAPKPVSLTLTSVTHAQRQAKWRKANPEKHAEQQRKHRGRSANR